MRTLTAFALLLGGALLFALGMIMATDPEGGWDVTGPASVLTFIGGMGMGSGAYTLFMRRRPR